MTSHQALGVKFLSNDIFSAKFWTKIFTWNDSAHKYVSEKSTGSDCDEKIHRILVGRSRSTPKQFDQKVCWHFTDFGGSFEPMIAEMLSKIARFRMHILVHNGWIESREPESCSYSLWEAIVAHILNLERLHWHCHLIQVYNHWCRLRIVTSHWMAHRGLCSLLNLERG